MFDRIPFGGTRRIMTDLDLYAETIAKSVLELELSESGAIPVATSTIGQDQKLVGIGIVIHTYLQPPCRDRIDGEFGSVPTCSDTDKPLIANRVIDAVGYGHSVAIGRKVMIHDLDGLTTPSAAGLMEHAEEFTTLGVDADHRNSVFRVSAHLAADIEKLPVPLSGIRRITQARLQAFQILSKREVHIL